MQPLSCLRLSRFVIERTTTAPATSAHPATYRGAIRAVRILLPILEILEDQGTIVFGRVASQIILGATDVVVLIIGERGVLLDDLWARVMFLNIQSRYLLPFRLCGGNTVIAVSAKLIAFFDPIRRNDLTHRGNESWSATPAATMVGIWT